MNKTNTFFTEYILPLHGKKEVALKCAPSPESDSYYENPTKSDYLYFTFLQLLEVEGLTSALKSLWKEEKCMVDLIDALVAVAMEKKKENAEQAEDLEEFVYVMF